MGVCSSCLSGARDQDSLDEDEQSRLLFDDPHATQYGSFENNHTGVIQADPQEVQRETEALQKVVAQTSNHLVDIFAMVPQNMPPTPVAAFPAQDARISRYQDVLAKLSANGLTHSAPHLSVDNTPPISDGWISEEDDVEEAKGHGLVKSEDVGPLLGGFADADGVD
ncbi:late endosomal/lysosomal adaptor and MAPK and MTOR activator-domain-containing protein [Bisporella sp. PMI_857]|nr:late endosomal/lysosomal adaptor and MAPK and MTOR activator-domain-containing protein [Bisporella sp. PMI_857]